MRSEVIVCTRNRPDDIERLVGALVQQMSKPRLIVIDSSEDARTRALVEAFAESDDWGLVSYVHSDPGLTVQRMRGIAELSDDCEIVHFIDDDVVPDPGYFSAIEASFERDADVVGIGGLVLDSGTHRARLLNRIFLLDSLREGAVLRSGVNVRVFAAERPVRVQWLSGCAMSYRRTVFGSVSFDTSLKGYALGEDVEFSFSVGALGALWVLPQARIQHLERGANELDRRVLARSEAVRRYAFVQRHRRAGVSVAAFWWSLVGDCVVTFWKSLLLADREIWRSKLRGLLEAVREIRRAGEAS